MKKKRWLGVFACIAVGILAGCNQDDKVSAEPKKKDISVEVADVAYGSLRIVTGYPVRLFLKQKWMLSRKHRAN